MSDSKPIGAMLHNTIKELSHVGIIKQYAAYLVDKGMVSNFDALKKYLDPIMSTAIDRGDMSLPSVESLCAELKSNTSMYFKANRKEMHDAYLDHALLSGVIKDDMSRLASEDYELFLEAKDAMTNLMNVRKKIVDKYGDLFLGLSSAFYNGYKKMFDAGFEDVMRRMGYNTNAASVNMGL